MNTHVRIESCPACGVSVQEGAKYCASCGAPLDVHDVTSCGACGQRNPKGAQFCLACGAPVGSVAQAERRVVTVLFADVSGFTELTEESDPEEVRELIAQCLDRLCQCITRWGGFVDKFIGDCVMALFGAPVTHENDPERAVRAALDMHVALAGLTIEGLARRGYRPQVRIGINTGSVVTGLFSAGGERDYTAVGDTVNVASRVQGLCEPGRILVGPTTYERTRHLFEFEPEQVLQVKGRREPVHARYVQGVRAERGKVRGFQEKEARFIGRVAELSGLRDRWRRAKEGEAQICLLTGPAGLGKSRLLEELVAVERLLVEQFAQGRSYPYASSTPWAPISELVRDLYNLPLTMAPAEAAARIAEAGGGTWEAVDVAALKVALGSPISEVPELQPYRPQDRHDRIVAAVVRAIEEAATDPRLLILEDLHWADRTTLELLCDLPRLGLRGPILTVLVTRPPLAGEAVLARLVACIEDRVDLAPLTPEEAREFVEATLGAHEMPQDFLDVIIGRAEGNPLFIEGTLRSVVDAGALRAEDGVWRAHATLSEFEVPDTIESVLATRIDALDTSAKRVLQYAAIVGRRFWSGVLRDALAKQPVERELEVLRDGAFVRPLPSSMVSGDHEFMFEHLLLQEVAYQGLLRSLRAQLHGAVARWLEEHFAAQGTEHAEWVAFHYERSKEPARAVPLLERAARSARARGGLSDAKSLVQRALKAAAEPEDRVRLLTLVEEIAAALGDDEVRRKAIEDLEALGGERRDERILAEASFRRARYLFDSGDLPTARATAQEAQKQFEKLGDVSRQGDALSLLGRVAHLWGEYPEAMHHYRASLPLQRRAGDRFGEAEVLDRIGLALIDIGDFTRSLDYFARARRFCAELGDLPTEARVVAHRATGLYWLGEYEEAEGVAREAVTLARQCGSRRAQAGTELTLGIVLAARKNVEETRAALQSACNLGREIRRPRVEARAWLALSEIEGGEEAHQSLQRARDQAGRTGLVHVEILALTRQAHLALEEGDLPAADRDSAQAVQKLMIHYNVQGPEEAVYYTRARALLALGRRKEGQEMHTRAQQIVQRKARHIKDAALRQRYLEGIPLNREILGPGVST
ncbi:MAG: AAA family ATPase [Gemmatimonadetes bacterium]|nr:AAA family ATPase [Gemmatimonadota bacterium]